VSAEGAGARKRRRLSRSGEFDRVYREGSSRANRYLVLYSFPRGEEDGGDLRLGVTAGRKIGGAVQRNRVKRTIREAFWNVSARLEDGKDYVVVARHEIGELIEREGTAGVEAALLELRKPGP
jgi:ribonuclease P protein component